MMYKAHNGNSVRVKLPLSKVNDFIPAPNLVRLPTGKHIHWTKDLAEKYRIMDITEYVRRSLSRGECILVRDDEHDRVTVVCTRLTAIVRLADLKIVNIM